MSSMSFWYWRLLSSSSPKSQFRKSPRSPVPSVWKNRIFQVILDDIRLALQGRATMLFAIDIDNTIARDTKNAALRAYVLRALDMPTDEQALRAWMQNAENAARFRACCAASETVPEVMGALQPIAGALDGVKQLAR